MSGECGARPSNSDSAMLAYSRARTGHVHASMRLGSPSSGGLFKKSRRADTRDSTVRSAVMTTGFPWSARTCAPGTVNVTTRPRSASASNRVVWNPSDRTVGLTRVAPAKRARTSSALTRPGAETTPSSPLAVIISRAASRSAPAPNSSPVTSCPCARSCATASMNVSHPFPGTIRPTNTR